MQAFFHNVHMGYDSHHTQVLGMLYRAESCPFLVAGVHCAGGDYCPFPGGRERLCCFWCGKLVNCPDTTGICVRLKEK